MGGLGWDLASMVSRAAYSIRVGDVFESLDYPTVSTTDLTET
jgi:hypothetical protein